MSNYTPDNFVWRPCAARLGDDHPGPPLELPLAGRLLCLCFQRDRAPDVPSEVWHYLHRKRLALIIRQQV